MDDDFRYLYAKSSGAISIALTQLVKLKIQMDLLIDLIINDLEKSETEIDKMGFEMVRQAKIKEEQEGKNK